MAKPPARAEAVASALIARIEAGELLPGAWLPPVRDLAEEHRVARTTAQRALDVVIARGLAVRETGAGVRVRPPRHRRDSLDITRTEGDWRGFHVSMHRQGERPYTRTTITEDVPADPLVARWLSVPAGTHVLRRARVQGVEGEPPKQLSTTWFPPAIVQLLPILLQADTGPGGMHARMEDEGLELVFEDTLTCRRATVDECRQLELAVEDDPVLTVWRRCYDQDHRVVEATFRVIPGDRLEQIYRYQYRVS